MKNISLGNALLIGDCVDFCGEQYYSEFYSTNNADKDRTIKDHALSNNRKIQDFITSCKITLKDMEEIETETVVLQGQRVGFVFEVEVEQTEKEILTVYINLNVKNTELFYYHN